MEQLFDNMYTHTHTYTHFVWKYSIYCTCSIKILALKHRYSTLELFTKDYYFFIRKIVYIKYISLQPGAVRQSASVAQKYGFPRKSNVSVEILSLKRHLLFLSLSLSHLSIHFSLSLSVCLSASLLFSSSYSLTHSLFRRSKLSFPKHHETVN